MHTMTSMPSSLEKRAVAPTVEPNMDGREKMPGTCIHLQELWEEES